MTAVKLYKATDLDVLMMQEFIFEHGESPWNFLPKN
jgi:hypothetical protein